MQVVHIPPTIPNINPSKGIIPRNDTKETKPPILSNTGLMPVGFIISKLLAINIYLNPLQGTNAKYGILSPHACKNKYVA